MRTEPIACLRPTPECAAQFAAPPYDVFDYASGVAWARSHRASFLECDLPEVTFAPDETPDSAALMTRAKERLDERIADGTLLADDEPCYYLYRLEQDGASQTGIVCACAVSDYHDGTIRRHENTRAAKLADRIGHIRALGAQTGLIFLAYEDRASIDQIVEAATAETPLYEYEEDGIRETVWRIAQTDEIRSLRSELDGVDHAYIADGHHRAAAAAEVARMAREACDSDVELPSDSFLAILYPASQLQVHAYNRVVSDRCGMSAEELVEAIEAAGFEAAPSPTALIPTQKRRMGMYTDGRWWELTAPEPAEQSPASSLDVSLLQNLVLEPILGIADPTRNERISFVSGTLGTDSLEHLAGAEGVAFSMHPTSVEELIAVADAGQLMPPKSTWFAPKPRSGLFIRQLQADLGAEDARA